MRMMRMMVVKLLLLLLLLLGRMMMMMDAVLGMITVDVGRVLIIGRHRHPVGMHQRASPSSITSDLSPTPSIAARR